MSRAISLYMDRVTLSLDELHELERDAEALAKRRQARSPSAPRDEGADDSPPVDPRGERYHVFFITNVFGLLARTQSGTAPGVFWAHHTFMRFGVRPTGGRVWHLPSSLS